MSDECFLTDNIESRIANEGDHKIKTIDRYISHIDVKGQYINLVSPIRLTGRLRVTDELLQDSSKIDVERQPLQIGVDEAGRGPLLGSVHVAAAILPTPWSDLIESQPLKDTPLSMLTDSKQLSEKKRDMLYPLVQQHAVGYVLAYIPAAVIDQINILRATMLGMRLCTEALLLVVAEYIARAIGTGVDHVPIQAQVLFDGNRCPELDYPKLAAAKIAPSALDCQAWIKGDARHTSMAAASVLAKVSRDQTMYDLHAQYPQYGIAQHKGYPTRAHMQAIERYGVLSEHRRSFAPVRRALEKNSLSKDSLSKLI